MYKYDYTIMASGGQLAKYYFYLFVHASHLWHCNPLSRMNLWLGLMRLMVTRFQGKARHTEVLSPEPLKWQHQHQFQSDLLRWSRWFFISVLGPMSHSPALICRCMLTLWCCASRGWLRAKFPLTFQAWASSVSWVEVLLRKFVTFTYFICFPLSCWRSYYI